MTQTGMLRIGLSGTWAMLALLSPEARAFAQTPVSARGQAMAPRADTTPRAMMADMLIIRTTAKIDSLIQRLNNLPVNSREYFITDDSIRTALSALPGVPAGRSFTVRFQAARAGRFSPIDNIPQGWFGFLADGYNRLWDEPEGTIVQYFEYPTVVGVEANSPASRAGIRSGDSLVAYDGRDLLRYPVNLTTLQTPGRQVAVRLRRDGEGREVVIAVDKAPPNVMVDRRSAVMAKTLTAAPRATLTFDSVLDRRLVESRAEAGGERGPACSRRLRQPAWPRVGSAGTGPSRRRCPRSAACWARR